MKIKKREIENWLFFCLFAFCFLLSACSVPNLEESECTVARLEVKKFYSFHFGNEMKFSADNLKLREKFLTADFYKSVVSSEAENDVFTTNSVDFPKAFRLGSCKVIEPTKTDFEVVLFWKDDNRNEQKTIHVEAVKQTDKWLINRILY
jgi:hypothetical protein